MGWDKEATQRVLGMDWSGDGNAWVLKEQLELAASHIDEQVRRFEELDKDVCAGCPHKYGPGPWREKYCDDCSTGKKGNVASLRERIVELEKRNTAIKTVVDAQAEDEGLWGIPSPGEQSIVEAYLQQELRRLHAVIEDGHLVPKT